MSGGWESVRCCVCGGQDAERVLSLPHPDAPGGASYLVRCTGCGLRRLDPRPGAAVVGRYYGDDHNAYVGRRRGWAKQAAWDLLRDVSSAAPGLGQRLRVLRPIVRPIAQWAYDVNVPLDGRQPPCVLDVGCGYGDLLLYLQSRGCRVYGVDGDLRAAQRGRAYGVPIHVGRVQDLGLPAASVDAAVLCHSLEHLPDPADTLGEVSRVVRPGGVLHVALPNGCAVGLQQEAQGWGCLFHPVHLWYFDAQTAVRLLARYGFRPIRIAYATVWTNHWRLWRSSWAAGRTRAVVRQALGFCRRLARQRDGGDILRVVAVRH